MCGLKLKGDLPVSLAKDFSKGFSALLTYYEGMLMIRFVSISQEWTDG